MKKLYELLLHMLGGQGFSLSFPLHLLGMLFD